MWVVQSFLAAYCDAIETGIKFWVVLKKDIDGKNNAQKLGDKILKKLFIFQFRFCKGYPNSIKLTPDGFVALDFI